MKIMHIESGKHLYGGAKQVAYLIEGLQKRGIENILLCPQNSAIAKECEPFCHVLQIPMKGDADIGMIWRIAKAIRSQKPDIIHLHSRRGADIMGVIAAKLTNTPCILSRRVDNPEPAWIAKIKYSLYDHIITISEGIRAVLLNEGVDPKHVTCVHSAVNTSAYEKACVKESFLKEFSLSKDAKSIGVIAQLISRKGHRFLLQIAPDLVKEHPNLHILFFGKGPLKEELERSILEKNLQKHVKLVGFRDDLSKWIGCLDIVVHPALMEGLGVSLLQAAAAGVPIVAAPFGGMPEIVKDGIDGFLVDPQKLDKLREKIDILLNDQKMAKEFGQRGKEIVGKNFSIDSMVKGNIDIYKKVLA